MIRRLGCIADDFTGATDLANNLVRGGMRVLQTIGVPAGAPAGLDDVDAVVVALKSRSAVREEAVVQSLAAARRLRDWGADQIYFKICSTFDSTPQGNIGPVLEALMDELGATRCLVTPAFPATGRTVYQGHLFVGQQLLSDSPMRDHPLTPMRDASLLRLLQAQLDPAAGRRVGLLPHAAVARGGATLAALRRELTTRGQAVQVADAIDDADLHALAMDCSGDALVVAASGLALGLPAARGHVRNEQAARLPPAAGTRAILSGSCSAASNAQVAHFIQAGGAAHGLDPVELAEDASLPARVLAWAQARLDAAPDRPVLIHATAEPAQVRAAQQRLGAAAAGALVERSLAALAQGLVRGGVRQLVLAGGETSGACVQALGVQRLRIGAQIDPGVPWCHAQAMFDGPSPTPGIELHLALKSGNFGGPDFFTRAFALLAR